MANLDDRLGNASGPAESIKPHRRRTLTNDEIESCRTAFAEFDKDNSGAIDRYELKATLESMGQNPTDEELFDMIAAVDDDNSGEIDFSEFLQVMLAQKTTQEGEDEEQDTLDAFIALGGSRDKTGEISTEKLRSVIKDFGLMIDIERLIKEVDTDESGFVDFREFRAMMTRPEGVGGSPRPLRRQGSALEEEPAEPLAPAEPSRQISQPMPAPRRVNTEERLFS